LIRAAHSVRSRRGDDSRRALGTPGIGDQTPDDPSDEGAASVPLRIACHGFATIRGRHRQLPVPHPDRAINSRFHTRIARSTPATTRGRHRQLPVPLSGRAINSRFHSRAGRSTPGSTPGPGDQLPVPLPDRAINSRHSRRIRVASRGGELQRLANAGQGAGSDQSGAERSLSPQRQASRPPGSRASTTSGSCIPNLRLRRLEVCLRRDRGSRQAAVVECRGRETRGGVDLGSVEISGRRGGRRVARRTRGGPTLGTGRERPRRDGTHHAHPDALTAQLRPRTKRPSPAARAHSARGSRHRGRQHSNDVPRRRSRISSDGASDAPRSRVHPSPCARADPRRRSATSSLSVVQSGRPRRASLLRRRLPWIRRLR
jgi:hypothetical protein